MLDIVHSVRGSPVRLRDVVQHNVACFVYQEDVLHCLGKTTL